MRRHTTSDAGAIIDGIAREGSTFATAKERLVCFGGATRQAILTQHVNDFLVQRHGAFMTTLAVDSNRLLFPVDILLDQSGALAGSDAGAVEQREQGTI